MSAATGHTDANCMLKTLLRVQEQSEATLTTVLEIALEHSDAPELQAKSLPAGRRLLRQLQMACAELGIPLEKR